MSTPAEPVVPALASAEPGAAPIGSLVDVPMLGPAMMLATGLCVVFEALLHDLELGGLAFLALSVPTCGTTAAGFYLARRRGWAALGALALAAVVEMFGAAVVVQNAEGAMLGVVFVGITYVLALPAFGIIFAMAHRREHDAGDMLLRHAACWFGLGHVGMAYWLAGDERAAHLVALLVAGLCAAVFGVVVQRAAARRRFCARVAAGTLAGFRVRPATPAERLDLAPVFALGARPASVLERLVVPASSAAAPYRGGALAEPVALVPAGLG